MYLRLLIILLAFSFAGFAQSNAKLSPNPIDPNPPALTEVLIGIPNLKPTQFNSVKESLKTIHGVQWSGFCDDQSVIFLLVNRAIQTNDKEITDVLIGINKNFIIYFMRGTFTEELNNCRDKEKAMTR